MPLSVLELLTVLDTSDVPPGVVNLISGDRAALTKTLAEHSDVDAIWAVADASTRSMIERMSAKLAGHSMFGGDGLRRLQMCADCRVIDMMEAKNTQQDPSILDIPPSGKRTPS
jgi:hypothetical protein